MDRAKKTMVVKNTRMGRKALPVIWPPSELELAVDLMLKKLTKHWWQQRCLPALAVASVAHNHRPL